MNVDVIVVGAGTGGSTTAAVLANLGVEVLLIDRKDEISIGKKVCGDAVPERPFHYLKKYVFSQI